jgi:hypothetical protein
MCYLEWFLVQSVSYTKSNSSAIHGNLPSLWFTHGTEAFMKRVLAVAVLAAMAAGMAGCADPYAYNRYRASSYHYPAYYYYDGPRVVEVHRHPHYGWAYPDNRPVPHRWHGYIRTG